MLFPGGNKPDRLWPTPYWIDLAYALYRQTYRPLILVPENESRYDIAPAVLKGCNWQQLAALCQLAKLVICNDSFAAHFAGTIGAKTIVLMGPTRPRVFSYCPEIMTMAGSLDCTGCHYLAGYRRACTQGCSSLYTISPQMVYEQAEKCLA